MTKVDYVAREILQMLHRYDNKRDGSYSAYIARVAIAASKEADKAGYQ